MRRAASLLLLVLPTACGCSHLTRQASDEQLRRASEQYPRDEIGRPLFPSAPPTEVLPERIHGGII